MSDLDQTLAAGTLLLIETGEYSDYRVDGPVRVLRDFSKREAAEAYVAGFQPDYDGDDSPEPGGFMGWLVANGYVEAVGDSHSWHVGSYGRFEP